LLSISEIILKNLISDSEYSTRVLPFLKEEYFERRGEKVLFSRIYNHIDKFKQNPTFESLYVAISEARGISEKDVEEVDSIIKEIKGNQEQSQLQWLVENTEKFCKDRAFFNALATSISVVDGQEKKITKESLPDLMRDALAISFDISLGHDYIEDAEDRYEYYHKVDNKIPFGLETFNKITKNGVSRKTLSLLMAPPHAGKSALLCHLAAENLKAGKDVVYFTMEMSEEEISKRIDANLMNLTIDEVLLIPKDVFLRKINAIKSKTIGKLKVKEYGMSTAHTGHFMAFLKELKLKEDFSPDIIYIDYLNICTSKNVTVSSAGNSYNLYKMVSEEIRAMAQELDVAIISATQINRGGSGKSDPGMGDVAESYGVNFGVDLTLALVVNDALKEMEQMLIIQLKNRFDNLDKMPKFCIGFNREKMKFYDLDDPVNGITNPHANEDVPVMDRGSISERLEAEKDTNKKTTGFKF